MLTCYHCLATYFIDYVISQKPCGKLSLFKINEQHHFEVSHCLSKSFYNFSSCIHCFVVLCVSYKLCGSCKFYEFFTLCDLSALHCSYNSFHLEFFFHVPFNTNSKTNDREKKTKFGSTIPLNIHIVCNLYKLTDASKYLHCFELFIVGKSIVHLLL